MVKYLCVAEKPSISKSITQILSGGQFNTRNARHPQWIKNYDFSYRMPPGAGVTDFTVTAVAGHLMVSDFEGDYKSWKGCDPFLLFDAPIRHSVNPDPAQKGIEANLIAEARKATHLMIWTDCDREGEHIGSEVANICRKAKPGIIVQRARFSAIIAAQINHACRNPVALDMRQANAVAARMDLDLRIGAAFTRTQTLGLQTRLGALEDKLISYGSCQFPTLGFVVDQYERVQAFVPESFWYIAVTLTRDDKTVSFTWRRGRLFDQEVVELLFTLCEDEPEATVTRRQTKPTQKWKPLPLTTVELQKTGSRLLRMTPKQILDTSDSLYQRGLLSYPRTETDQFDKDFNFDELIDKQVNDAAWGPFATNLRNGGFERPRNGKKNDKAHPPIHPTSHAGNLAGDDKKVYDLVTRRFLACCSKNARGMETTVEIEIAGETFSATGLTVTERNYLEVYVYDKWNGNLLPPFEEGEQFDPTTLDIKVGTTTQPNLLTEADLVSLMDKNGIGTDATIAEHISKIIEREYVMKQPGGGVEYLCPSTLGIGLVEGYNAIGFEKSLSKPHLRRLTEHRMTQICEGNKTKQEVVDETLDEYRDMYIRTKRDFETFVTSVRRYIEGDDDDDSDDDDQAGNGGGGGPPAARGRGRGQPRGRGAAPAGRGVARGGAAPAGRGAARGAARGAPPRGGAAPRARGRGRGGAAQPLFRAPSPEDDGDLDGFFDGADNDLDNDEDDDQDHDFRGGGGGRIAARAAPAPVDAVFPDCGCQEPAIEKTVTKESANKGRKFFTCTKGQSDGCGFFQWSDEPPRVNNGAQVPQKRAYPGNNAGVGGQQPQRARPPPKYNNEEEDDRRCQCDLQAARKVVTKEGPNTGRGFFVCPNVSKAAQCKYFEWDDEGVGGAGGGGGPAPRGGGGGNQVGECYICHQDGHWSSACPQKNQAGPSQARNNGGGGGGQTGECYICHEEGHWSSACPQKGQGGPSQARGGGGQTGECYICHEEGHWSSACPQKNAGGGGGSRGGAGGGSTFSCFKCGEEGHFSNACPNEGGAAPAPKGRGRGRGRAAKSGGARGQGRGRGKY